MKKTVAVLSSVFCLSAFSASAHGVSWLDSPEQKKACESGSKALETPDLHRIVRTNLLAEMVFLGCQPYDDIVAQAEESCDTLRAESIINSLDPGEVATDFDEAAAEMVLRHSCSHLFLEEFFPDGRLTTPAEWYEGWMSDKTETKSH